MTRPLRLEFAGALYHVTSRGDRKSVIYRDDADRRAWIETLDRVCQRHNFLVHCYCQMGNHYHLLVETLDGNLSQGMRQLNGLYTQHFNRHHKQVGHLFQGRYKSILVQKESYLLELTRYVVLNPLRANVVGRLEEWPWSSHRFFMGEADAPQWLETNWLLRKFGATQALAVPKYYKFVMAGVGRKSPLKQVSHQLILGDSRFVQFHHNSMGGAILRDISKAQRRAVALPLAEYRKLYPLRDEAMARAYHSTAFTMAQIGAFFGVSPTTVARAVQRFEPIP